MSEGNKHSPGPWRVQREYFDNGKLFKIKVVASNGEVICDDEEYYPQFLQEYNADIIAAAPEMKAMIYKLLSSFKPQDTVDLHIIEEANVLLSKAGGNVS